MDLISDAVGSIRDGLIHVGNGNYLTLGLVIAGIALVGYFFLRR